MNAKRRILPEPLTKKWNHWEFHAVIELLRGDTGQPIRFPKGRWTVEAIEVDLETQQPERVDRRLVVQKFADDLVDRYHGMLGAMVHWEREQVPHNDLWTLRLGMIANGDRFDVTHQISGDALNAGNAELKASIAIYQLRILCKRVVDAILDPPTPIERTLP